MHREISGCLKFRGDLSFSPLRPKLRNKLEVYSKVKPEPGSNRNPTRKALPDLQL